MADQLIYNWCCICIPSYVFYCDRLIHLRAVFNVAEERTPPYGMNRVRLLSAVAYHVYQYQLLFIVCTRVSCFLKCVSVSLPTISFLVRVLYANICLSRISLQFCFV